MNHATEQYSTEKIMELINDYSTHIKHLAELNREYYENVIGGNIAMYGIEASMPKAIGQNGDPVFREVHRLIKTDKSIDRLERKVRYIQNRWDRIIDEKHAVVFNNRLRGLTYLKISEILNCTPQRIHQLQVEIAVLLKD